MKDYAKQLESEPPQEETIQIDAELPSDYMTPELIELVEKFEPYGEESPPLVFLIKNMKIHSVDLVGKKEIQHVKLILDYGKYKWPGLLWNGSERVGRDFDQGDSIDVVFRLNRNYYLNKETLQLTILDAKRA